MDYPAFGHLEPHRWMAETVYERLKSGIESQQADLKDDEELVISYSAPGIEMQVTSIGFHNPSIIYLFGVDTQGRETTAMVGMEAISLFLQRARREPTESRRPIGFRAEI